MDDGSHIARTTQKTALHYEIKVDAALRKAPAPPLSAIVKAFAKASANGEAAWRQGSHSFEVARVRFNKAETRVVLLIRYTDAIDELNAAHLVIDLTPRDGAYCAVLEEAPGLSKTRLEFGMEALTRRLCEGYVPTLRGQFRKTHPRLVFDVVAGEPVAFVLERASLLCEPEIRPAVSVKLDALLRQRAAQLAAQGG